MGGLIKRALLLEHRTTSLVRISLLEKILVKFILSAMLSHEYICLGMLIRLAIIMQASYHLFVSLVNGLLQ